MVTRQSALMNVVIIGAGPAGNYIAYLLAKQGHTINVFEEHPVIGSPIQCTGILTEDITEFFPNFDDSDTLVNVIEQFKIYAPNNTYFKVQSKEYVVCRTRFDQSIASLASQAGVMFHTSHRCTGFEDSIAVFDDKKTKQEVRYPFDLLIGADGPRSIVSKTFFPKNSIPTYSGMQTVVTKNKKDVEQNTYAAYLGSDYPEFFGWDVPEGPDKTRVGLAVRGKVIDWYDKFCDKLSVSRDMIGERQGGQIPIFNWRNKWYTYVDSKPIVLIGDAATQIKSTTGGGIIPSLKSATLLANCIKNNTLHKYKPSIFSRVGRELYAHLFIRKMLDTMTDKQYNTLIRICTNKKVTHTLETISRDNAAKLLPMLFLREPLFFLYSINGVKGFIRMFRE